MKKQATTDEEYLKRFFSRTTINPTTGCLEWNGARSHNGYGISYRNGRTGVVSRFVYELLNQVSLLKTTDVCHTCDNRSCINPNHLWLGTRLDNMKDMMQKKGHHKCRTKLTHCKRGHLFNEENTKRYVNALGSSVRGCRACSRYTERIRKSRKRLEKKLGSVPLPSDIHFEK